MLHGLRVEKLRSITDTLMVPLRPLTVLVGRNSSGKSSFLRTFPLLRQSVERPTSSPVLWYGPLADFGIFREAAQRGHEIPEVAFSFELDIGPGRILDGYRELRLIDKLKVVVRLVLREGPNGAVARECSLSCGEDLAVLTFGEAGGLEGFTCNGLDVLAQDRSYTPKVTPGYILPQIVQQPGTTAVAGLDQPVAPLPAASALFEALRRFEYQTTAKWRTWDVLVTLGYGGREEMLQNLREAASTPTWIKRTGQLSVASQQFRRIAAMVFANHVPVILRLCDGQLFETFQRVSYIGPFRAAPKRYYRPQDLPVDEVDPFGENLLMFLRSLPDEEFHSFSGWMNQHFGLTVVLDSDGSHLKLSLRDPQGKIFNLVDMGYGYSQVLPVVAQLWSMRNAPAQADRRRRQIRLLAIEQPELHLHPEHQARLADLFAAVINSTRRPGPTATSLFVETHSEALVNRLGQLVFERKLQPGDMTILLFEKDETIANTSLTTAMFDQEGMLQNWPIGFFAARG